MSAFWVQFSAVALWLKWKVSETANSHLQLKNKNLFDFIVNFLDIKESPCSVWKVLTVPPIRHFPDNRPTDEFETSITGVVTLIEDEVNVAAGTVNVVNQKVRGENIPIGAPL